MSTDPSRIALVTFNVVPANDKMLKYERLGQMALENRSLYCQHHGYTFLQDVPIADDRPACWAKIPALMDALEDFDWVLWADSDALIFDSSRRIEEFCDPNYHLIVQNLDRYFQFLGVDAATGRRQMPINTGVFLMRAGQWSQRFLQQSYQQAQYVSQGDQWDGIGDQEAMTEVLRRNPHYLRHIGYVDGLQCGPKFYNRDYMFVHFYGHYTRHHIPADQCEEVIKRWENAVAAGRALPSDLARFHWCNIQNKDSAATVVHGDLTRYLYTREDILA